MHFLMLSGGDEARGSLLLVDRSVTANLGTPRLRLGSRPQRLRCSLSVIQAAAVADDGIGIALGQQLGMQHGAVDSLRLSCSCAGSVQDLGDMNELHGNADALGAAPLMHQARAVGRDDVFGAGLRMVADLVVAHLGGNDLLEHREGAAEAAALVRARRPNKLDAVNFGKQVDGLGEERLV